VGPEQTEILIAKGRTLAFGEFKYAPESHKRALSSACAPHAHLNNR